MIAPKIGFMQGRLSPLVDGKIQAFPWAHWRDEFPAADECGIHLMEWTLDHDRLSENPLMTRSGRQQIAELQKKHELAIESLTGDLFMQAPFWKVDGLARRVLLDEFDAVMDACAALGIRFIVVPLVDNGALATEAEEYCVLEEMRLRADALRQREIAVVFECDFAPHRLANFIGKLPADNFGVNFDIGNSAALGYDSSEEIAAYGRRILNVHVKDRKLGGTTVPLGTGNANLGKTIRELVESGYRGNYILQTARASDGDHAGVLQRYRDMTKSWLAAANAK